MKYLLITPNWTFRGSVYFGCREPHLPLEYGYAQALLEAAGHDVLLLDGHMHNLSLQELRDRAAAFAPDIIVIATAPSYLFWRCPPPELRVPRETLRALGPLDGIKAVIGPHGSVTPGAVLDKLGADIVIRGEPEEVLPLLGTKDRRQWRSLPSVCYREDGGLRIQGGPHASDMAALQPLRWPREVLAAHRHHHHRFDRSYERPGAEVEGSRGCPYRCSFCAREGFRERYRKRPLPFVLSEIDDLLAKGVDYLYFIDELFMPDRLLLAALAERRVEFGIQTRIDLWTPELLEALGRAGCVSIEAGVESVSEAGRLLLGKRCTVDDRELEALLLCARQQAPFVQATLLNAGADDPAMIAAWRDRLGRHAVWTNEPVPLFPYPGSGEYAKRWGRPDDTAWERAHEFYLANTTAFSDIQEEEPLPLSHLELCTLC